MSKKSTLIFIVFLFFLNLFFRFSLISKGPYHPDCLHLALQAEKTLATGQMQYLQGSGLPLTVLLGAGFVWLLKSFGIQDPVYAVNFMSVVFSSLSIVAMFLFVQSYLNKSAALISAVLLSLHPLFLALSTFGNSHPPATFFFLLGLWALSEFHKQHRFSLIVISGVCFGLMATVRLQDFAIVLPSIILFILSPPKTLTTISHESPSFIRRASILFSILVTSGILVFFSYLPALLKASSDLQSASAAHTLNEHFFKHLLPFSFVRTYDIFLYFLSMFSPLEWTLAVTGLIFLFKKDLKFAIYLLVWMLLPLLVFTNLRFYELRLTLVSILPVSILAAYVLSLFNSRKLLFYSFTTLTFLFVFLNLTNFLPRIYFRHQNDLLPKYFIWIKDVTEPGAYIIERDHSQFIEHYANRRPLQPNLKLYGPGPNAMENFRIQLDDLLAKNIPVYITKFGLTGYTYGGFKDLIYENYDLHYIGSTFIEDWHLGCMFQSIVQNELFRIQQKATGRSESIETAL